MKAIGPVLALVLFAPFAALAHGAIQDGDSPASDVGAFVSGIISNTSVQSSSGGIVAPGATASGDASASANIKTIINSGVGSTIYKTDIRVESDGVVRTESVEKVVPANGRVEVRIGTSTGRARVEMNERIDRGSGAGPDLSSFFNFILTPSAPPPSVRTDEDSSFGVSLSRGGIFGSFWSRARSFFGFF